MTYTHPRPLTLPQASQRSSTTRVPYTEPLTLTDQPALSLDMRSTAFHSPPDSRLCSTATPIHNTPKSAPTNTLVPPQLQSIVLNQTAPPILSLGQDLPLENHKIESHTRQPSTVILRLPHPRQHPPPDTPGT